MYQKKVSSKKNPSRTHGWYMSRDNHISEQLAFKGRLFLAASGTLLHALRRLLYGTYSTCICPYTDTPLQLTSSFSSLPCPRFPSQTGFLIFVFLSQQFLYPRKNYSSLGAWQLTLRSNPASRTWTTFAISGAHGYGPNWQRDLQAARWRKSAKRWGLLYRRFQRQLDQSEMESISISMGSKESIYLRMYSLPLTDRVGII